MFLKFYQIIWVFFGGGAKVSRISLLDDAWKNFEKTAISWNREVKTKGYFL